jgi:hypothetical protein
MLAPPPDRILPATFVEPAHGIHLIPKLFATRHVALVGASWGGPAGPLEQIIVPVFQYHLPPIAWKLSFSFSEENTVPDAMKNRGLRKAGRLRQRCYPPGKHREPTAHSSPGSSRSGAQ